MATRKPLVLTGGQQQEMQAGDTIDPAVLPATSGGDTIAYFMAGG